MKSDTVQWNAITPLFVLDLNAVRITGSDFMQRHDVDEHEADQCQRQGNDMQGKKAVECDIRDRIITADKLHDPIADHRYCAK